MSVIFINCLAIVLAVFSSHLVTKSASAAGNQVHTDTPDKVGTELRKRAFPSSTKNEKIPVLLQLGRQISAGVLLADVVLLADGILASDEVLWPMESYWLTT